MRKLFKSVLVLILALIIAISSLVVVAAETADDSGNNGASYITDGGAKAYQLVWKYKSDNGHMWKRRWNMTLGIWYDPDWILVY